MLNKYLKFRLKISDDCKILITKKYALIISKSNLSLNIFPIFIDCVRKLSAEVLQLLPKLDFFAKFCKQM